MKKGFLFLVVVFFYFSAISQNVEMWEVNVASNSQQVDNMSIDWTIGQLLVDLTGDEVSLISNINSGSVLVDIKEDVEHQLMYVKLYPNPASNEVNLDFDKLVNNVKICVCNINGAVVLEKQYSGTKLSISTEQIPDGMYFIKAFDGRTEIAKQKVIIQH